MWEGREVTKKKIQGVPAESSSWRKRKIPRAEQQIIMLSFLSPAHVRRSHRGGGSEVEGSLSPGDMCSWHTGTQVCLAFFYRQGSAAPGAHKVGD